MTSGVNAGAVAISVSFAKAVNVTTVDAFVGSDSEIEAGNDIVVGARFNVVPVTVATPIAARAVAKASTGSLLGGAGSLAFVKSTPVSRSTLGSGTRLLADHDVDVASEIHHDVQIKANALDDRSSRQSLLSGYG
jgi:hypothetical protein